MMDKSRNLMEKSQKNLVIGCAYCVALCSPLTFKEAYSLVECN